MKNIYGFWTVLGPSKRYDTNKSFLCRCKCGVEKWISYSNLLKGASKSCGCTRSLIGKRFGKLTVIQWLQSEKRYLCKCDCGNTTKIFTSNFISTKSCGCIRIELNEKSKASSYSRTPEYKVWSSMLNRCRNPNSPAYPRYGKRGIKVCKRWTKFKNFITDMGKRPYADFCIDRINNDGNYKPSNCRWTTRTNNTNNRSPGYRSSRYVTFNNETLTVSEWAKRLGIKIHTLFHRLDRGWTIQRALTTKIRPYPSI